jgi:tetratricopeptide (TPR) repeat protein
MKKLSFLLFLICVITSAFAQNGESLDKEKLFDFYQSQKYAEAAAYLKSVYGNDVSDLKTITQIGYCYLMAGNNVEAENYYTKAYGQQPQSLPILFSLASINVRRGNSEKAKTYYGEIIKIDSNNFSVYKLLANLYSSSKDSIKMIYLKKANNLNPLEGDVAFDLADAYSRYQDYEKAYRVLDIAIAADTNNLVLQRAKLPVANALKKYPEVIISGEKLLKDEIEASVVKDVAKAYYAQKKYQKAVDYFKIIEQLKLANEATLYYTSLCYRALKNYPLAAIYTKKTIEEGISPNTSNYYTLLGLVYQETNKLSQSLAAYKKGMQYKTIPTLYYRMAVLYDTDLKQSKNAKTYYNMYLKSRPDIEADKEEIEFARARLEQLNLPTK